MGSYKDIKLDLNGRRFKQELSSNSGGVPYIKREISPKEEILLKKIREIEPDWNSWTNGLDVIYKAMKLGLYGV